MIHHDDDSPRGGGAEWQYEGLGFKLHMKEVFNGGMEPDILQVW